MNRYRQFKRCLASALSAMMLVTGLPVNTFAAPDVDQKITIDIEKTWQDGNNAEGKRPASVVVQLKNGDEVVQTLTITPDEEGNWKGSFEDVPRYDSEGKEIKYTVQEVPVPGYDDVEIIQGEIEDDYKYPATISDAVLDVATSSKATVDVTGGSDWHIQPGLQTDWIEATQAVFNPGKLAISKATFQEYDKDGNRVAANSGDSRFKKNGSSISFNPDTKIYPNLNTLKNALVETDHYYTLTFPDAVTILDGTSTGSTLPVVMTVSNVSIYKINQGTGQVIMKENGQHNLEAGPGGGGIGGISMDMNFKVPGVTSGQTLLSFVDLDVTAGKNAGGRQESIYLLEGIEDTFYTLPLKGTNPTKVTYTAFKQQEDGSVRAYALDQDTPYSLNSGLVARANLSEEGFNIRWTGYSCGTGICTEIKPFALKTTVNDLTAGGTGGTISEQGEWRYRNYGEPKVITMTPNTGYHIQTIKIDGKEIDLSGLEESGELTVEKTGWTGNGRTGVENITFYQREKGVVDVYLPAQYYAINAHAATRTDHWIDVQYTPNGVAQRATPRSQVSMWACSSVLRPPVSSSRRSS